MRLRGGNDREAVKRAEERERGRWGGLREEGNMDRKRIMLQCAITTISLSKIDAEEEATLTYKYM